ncbi:hypothetical protein DFH08DRAFT_815846 [Mycena albidolilacea]|uniref:DUF7779 domain-containing protein n=1 Tax=Mycena albidolilacea TaxID=1033008 RepID=A0AAD6ZLD8_9AGAR|nr:hypothetical protein DFH08DRAFT_815846 [Mycena albidolilacea]
MRSNLRDPNSPPAQSVSPSTGTRADPDTNWVSNSLLAAKAISAGVDCLPFPYVDGLFRMVVILLETVEKLKKNRDDLKELCECTVEIIKTVSAQISSQGKTAALRLQDLCRELEHSLQDVLEVVTLLQRGSNRFRDRFQAMLKLNSTADEICKYRNRIRELRLNFIARSPACGNDRYKLPGPEGLELCITRTFVGRQNILRMMHDYFVRGADTNQEIFLLHGLGGSGKTQIALKFIQQSTLFSEVFLIDSTTLDTIESGLKDIAVSRNIGEASQVTLQWLCRKHDNWLLFFDNADDPRIDLNSYFPLCNHGNLLITSRNPGLQVYAGADFLVSDMEESESAELLLKTAAKEDTAKNRRIALDIVKELSYLPLAIIQAGAFISKSGALNSYLALYKIHRTRLLSEKPAQSHDNYGSTVYTTWQLSFGQLTSPAVTLLQICSFLHHKNISEKIFSNASTYKVRTLGPSREELKKPLGFLAHFLTPGGDWDSIRFIEVTNQLRAYSLINFDSETGLFSIHPLVHSWSQSTIVDLSYMHASALALVGMSAAQLPEDQKHLSSIQLLPHVDSLLQGDTNMTPDFALEYGEIYHYCGQARKAKELQIIAFEKFKNHLGKDHADTLQCMESLALTFQNLRNHEEAEELQLFVLEKRKHLLGLDNVDTLRCMGSLAFTRQSRGKLQSAKELQMLVVPKQERLLGNDHPDTLSNMSNLALSTLLPGHVVDANDLLTLVADKQRGLLGDCHPHTLITEGRLGHTLQMLGEMTKAAELQAVLVEKSKSVLGDSHPETLREMNTLAWSYYNLGQLKEAEEIQLLGRKTEAYELDVRVLSERTNQLGAQHPDSIRAQNELALTYHALGRVVDAKNLQVEVLEKRGNILGKDHPGTLNTMGELALSYRDLRQFRDAEELEVSVLEKRRKVLGENHPLTLLAIGNLVMTYKLEKFTATEILEVELL